jgi:FkbM family methyltransferase
MGAIGSVHTAVDSPPPPLSCRVVVPVHNAAATLGAQLEALSRQRPTRTWEVVVVLNRCTDSSASIADEFASDLPLTVIAADAKGSAAYARNAGAHGSSTDTLLFCDADDRVGAGWIDAMTSRLRSVDLVGGRIDVDREGLPAWIYMWRYRSLDGHCLWNGPSGLPYPLAASMGCTRSLYESIEGFDEEFLGAGGEEVDFAARSLRAGFRIGEAPDAHVDYAPRTTARAALRQVRGYTPAWIEIQAREGILDPKPSVPDCANRLLRMAARLVRQGHRRPSAIACRVLEESFMLASQRARGSDSTRSPATAPENADFLVPQSAPIIGGLALTARQGQTGWYRSEGVEHHSLHVLELVFPSAGTFVDVGANIGVFTLAALKQGGPMSHAVAFEPDPRTRSLLRENLVRHGVEACADVRSDGAGAETTVRTFHQYANDVVSGFGEAPSQYDPGDVCTIDVHVVRLDEVVPADVDMIKIDVEGFEPEVLAGASRLLATASAPILLLEVNPASLTAAGYTPDDLVELLPSERWRLWVIDDSEETWSDAVRPVRQSELHELSMNDARWYGNLLAVPRSRTSEVCARVPLPEPLE